MSRKFTAVTFAALLSLLLCAATAGATDVLFTNLGPNGEYDTTNGWLVNGAQYNNQVIAMPFTPTKNESVSDAVLALGYYGGNNTAVSLYLESDASGVPGSILATLTQQGTIPPFTSGGGLVQFNCASCPTLSTSNTYWMVAVEADAASDQVWMYNYGDTTGPFAFNTSGSPTGPWFQYNSTNSGFRVDGNGVPEPGTLVMFGSGILAAAAGLRRKLGV